MVEKLRLQLHSMQSKVQSVQGEPEKIPNL